MTVETNTGNNFLKVTDKYWILKRNNIEVSYSCLPVFANTIKKSTTTESYLKRQPKTNCWQKDTCPLEGNCLDKELIYQCNLKDNTTSNRVNYNSLTVNTSKNDFTNTEIPSNTRVMSIPQNYQSISGKWKGIENPIMSWSVFDHAKPYKSRSKRCNLCFTEK